MYQSAQRKDEFEEEHSIEGGALYGLEGQNRISKANVLQRAVELKETILRAYPNGTAEHKQAKGIRKTDFGARDWTKNIRDEDGLFGELDVLYEYLQMLEGEVTCKNAHKQALNALYESVIKKYATLTGV